ncbi:hypothetical protein HCU74_17060 [Spongiibacter sp. KMU-166]|uniref:Uncharacterized protein n=1 Tax=Spongiibacter thalassae TaxID=2721624 RepID=A0ABX1GIU0_9GAMM|nr:hypothetical protein [Spongiibacter thalassae]NKI19120.1 hypothetical protein [Spongiibacter thalassae]
MLQDADQLLAVGQEMQSWVTESDLINLKPVELFSAIYRRTSEYLTNGIPVEEAYFPATDLNADLKGIPLGEDSSDTAGKYVRTNYARMSEILAEHKPSLRKRLRKKGYREELDVEVISKPGDPRKYYQLKLVRIPESDDAESSSEPKSDPGIAVYSVRQLPKFLPWAKPFAELTLSGWRRSLFVGGMVTLFCAPLAVFLLAIIGGQLLLWHVLVGSAAAILLWLFKPLIDVVERSIVRAPDWMLRLNDVDVQLELREVGAQDNGLPLRQIRLVKYEAECPVCGGNMAVVSGKREFRGRMVGQCSRSRSEHLYSFDHISKRGVPLRTNGYYRGRDV